MRLAGLAIAVIANVGGQTLLPPTTYYGMCDASAAVALGADAFVVASDEDNVIRVYKRDPPGPPIFALDLSSFLNLLLRPREVDLEGAARVGDRIYWIASHGRDGHGSVSLNRQRFFATAIGPPGQAVSLIPVGQPYVRLLEDLYSDTRLRRYALDQASLLAPKLAGGLNIEGLVAMPEGHLLMGFRNPIPGGRALLLPLLNPAEMVAGQRARLGDPIHLDLGGFGVRSLGWANGKYLIIAGHYDDEGVSRLYEWQGPATTPVHIDAINFTGSNPEGMAFDAAGGTHDLFVLSDDGTLDIDGIGCKRLKDPAKRRFRSYPLILR